MENVHKVQICPIISSGNVRYWAVLLSETWDVIHVLGHYSELYDIRYFSVPSRVIIETYILAWNLEKCLVYIVNVKISKNSF